MPADPIDLGQLLSDLQAEAPRLPLLMRDPLEMTIDLRTAYNAFQHDWEERVVAAEAQVEAARTVLAELHTHADQIEVSVREATTSLDLVVDHHEEVIERELTELTEKMAAAGDSMNHLQSTLVTAGQDAQALATEVGQAAAELTAAARAGQDQLQAAAVAVLHEVDVLETEVRTATGEVTGDLDAFATALTAAAAKARDELTAALDQIALAVRTHAGYVGASATLVRQGRTERRTQTESGITRSVVTEVGGAAEHADQALDALAGRADHAADEAEKSGANLKDAIEKVAAEGGTLEKAIGLIKESADLVGILWPA